MLLANKKIIVWFYFFPVFILYQLFLWPILITNDGTTYLSSAVSILSDDMFSSYYWIREPLYPIFLKFTLLFETYSGVTLIVLQSLFLYLSFFLGYLISKNLFSLKNDLRLQIFFILTLFISGYFISYGAIVLQQALLSFFLTSLIYLSLFFNKELNKNQIRLGLVSYLLLSFITVNFFYQYLYLQIFISILIGYGIVKYSFTRNSSFTKKIIYIFLISFSLTFVQYLTTLPWTSFKNTAIQSSINFRPSSIIHKIDNPENTDNKFQIEIVEDQISDTSEVWSSPRFPSPLDHVRSDSFWSPDPNYLERFFAFFSLYEPKVKTLWKENAFFVGLQLSNRNAGTHLISARWQPYLDNALTVQPINNSSLNQFSTFSENFVSNFQRFNTFLYQMIAILFLIFSLYLIFFQRNTKYMQAFSVALVSMIPYLMTWPVDRYSIPLYPFMVAVVIGFSYYKFPQLTGYCTKPSTYKVTKILLGVFFMLYIFIYFFNLSFFQNNDDVLIFSIADGTFYGEKDGYLIYPSALLGTVFVMLYTYNESVNWYYILLVLTQLSSVFLVLKFLSRVIKLRIELYIILSLLIFSSVIFFSLQYTQTAIFAAGLASIVLLSSKIKHEVFIATILLVLASLWRFEAAFLGIATVFCIYILFERKNLFTQKSLLFLTTGLFAFVLNLATTNILPSSTNYDIRSFYSFNSARESVQGFASTKDIDTHLYKAAKKRGWSRNDYALSQRKSYASNQDIYTTDNYEYIYSQRYTKNKVSLLYEITNNYVSIIYNNYLAFVSFILLFTLLLYRTFSRIRFYEVIAFFLLLNVIFVSILWMGKLPDRIFWPLTIISLFSIFSINLNRTVSKKSENAFALGVLLPSLIIILFINMSNYFDLIKEERWWQSTVGNRDKGFERVVHFETDKPIVAFSSFYSPLFRTADPKLGPKYLPQIRRDLIIVGWVNRSPAYENNIKNLGLSQDLFTSVALGDAYLAIGQIEDLQMVNQYLIENKNIEVTWPSAPFVFSDTGLGIWKVKEFRYID